MDSIEMNIIAEIANPEVRDILLNAYRRTKPMKISRVDIKQSYRCPLCGSERTWKDGEHCKDCGQLLDW